MSKSHSVWAGGGEGGVRENSIFARAIVFDLNISAPELQKITVFVCPQFVINQMLLKAKEMNYLRECIYYDGMSHQNNTTDLKASGIIICGGT